MRRLLAAALALAALVLSGCTDDVVPGPGRAEIDVDTPALRAIKADAGIEECEPGEATDGGLPDLTLPCLGGGQEVGLASLRGPLVLNIWASWCGPCVKEMPAIAEFYDQYGDRVPVVGVDYQDPQTEPALELARKSGVTYPLLADPDGDLQAKEPFPAAIRMPMFAFVSADGEVRMVNGGIDSVDELVDLTEKHLGIDL